MAVVAQITSTKAVSADGSKQLVREYVIRDDAPQSGIGADIAYSAALSALPALGSTVSVGGQTAVCKSVEVASVSEGISKVWTGTATYQYADEEQGTATYTATDMNTVINFVDVWRVGANWPNLNNPGNGDIGGTPVDACGEPVSATVYNQEISVVNIKPNAQTAAVLATIGKRNTEQIFGIAAGYVLFVGASARRTGTSSYEVTYRFIYDGAAHLRQICARDVDGQPLLNAPDANGNATARHVMARQPFPQTANLTSSLGLVL